MKSDWKRLNYILTLSIISIFLIVLGAILLGTSFISSSDSSNTQVNINIASLVFGCIFSFFYLVIILVLVAKTMTQNWITKWCLKYNVAFAILGLFFGGLIFTYFAGVGKVKFDQEFKIDELIKKMDNDNLEKNI